MSKVYIKICKICGATFDTPNSRQQCCGAECMRINRKKNKREYNRRQKIKAANAKNNKPTSWGEISKRCKELGKSYGQAVADGDI